MVPSFQPKSKAVNRAPRPNLNPFAMEDEEDVEFGLEEVSDFF